MKGVKVSKIAYKYKRRVVLHHITWTEDSLALALEELDKKKVSVEYLELTEYPTETKEDDTKRENSNF
ncbi:unnamed protein product [Euphydryas editha]|uniref:Uncharacterized protein n=1 Tax=Euphydryas editha TaxID=104508 RepID=A0AAU9UTY4_EUPED|nr:unnamed protein product [Euphydryas editha]